MIPAVHQAPYLPPRTRNNQSSTPSWGERLLMGMGNVVASTVLSVKSTRIEDEAIIQSVIQDSGSIFIFIRQELPLIRAILGHHVPAIHEFLSQYRETSDQILEEMILHVIRNLACACLSEEHQRMLLEGKLPAAAMIDSAEFLKRCVHLIADRTGPLLNAIDARAADRLPKHQEFLPIGESIWHLLFPVEDTYLSWMPESLSLMIQDSIASTCCTYYRKFAGVEEEAVDEGPPSPMLFAVRKFLPQFIDWFSNHEIKESRLFLQELTGNEDLYALLESQSFLLADVIKEYVPDSVFEMLGILGNEEVIQVSSRACLLQITCTVFEKIFKSKLKKGEKVDVPHVMHKTVRFFSHKLRKAFKHAKKEDADFTQFYPDACALIEIFIPKLGKLKSDWMHQILARKQDLLFKPVAELHHCLFNATVNDKSEETYKSRLRQIFWNREAVQASGYFGSDPVPEFPTKEDATRAKIEPAVDLLFFLCEYGMKILKNSGSKYLNDPAFLHTLLNDLQKNVPFEQQIPAALIHKIALGIQSICDGSNSELALAGDYLEHFSKTLIFKGIVIWFEKVPEALRYPPEKLLAAAFDLVLAPGAAVLAEEEELIKAVVPAVDGWVDLFFNEGENQGISSHFPIPEPWQKNIESKLRPGLYSGFAKIFGTVTSWVSNRKSIQEELNALFPSKNATKLCNTIPFLVTQGIPYYAQEKGEAVVEKLMSIVKQSFDEDIEQLEWIMRLLTGFFAELGTNNSENRTQLIKFIGAFSETVVMQFLIDILSRVRQMELDSTSLISILEEWAIGHVGIAKNHVAGIGKTKVELDNPKPSRASYIKNFKENALLHPALEDELPGVRGLKHKNAFFSDATKRILEIFRIDKKTNIPLPAFAWEILLDQITTHTPAGLSSIMELLHHSSTFNQALIFILNKASQEDPISIIDRLFPDSETNDFMDHLKDLDFKFDDQYQLQLENELGEMLEAVISLQPDRIPKYLIQRPDLKQFAAEAIGQTLRSQLRSNKSGQPISILTLLDKVFDSVSEIIAPAVWDPDMGKFVFYQTSLSGKVQMDSITKQALTAEEPNLVRFFPISESEKSQVNRYNKKQIRRTERNVPRFVRKMVNHQTDQIAVDLFIQFWNSFKKELYDWLIINTGKENGEELYKTVLPIARWLIKYPLAVALLIFNYTIWLIVSQALQLILNQQVQQRVEDVHVDIHDNALFHGIDFTLDSLDKNLKQHVQEAAIVVQPYGQGAIVDVSHIQIDDEE